MEVKLFETIMLFCFGSAWPFSIYRTWKTKSSKGKSMFFLAIVLIGYISGIFFKIYGNLDEVLFLYVLNAVFVAVDMTLTLKYRHSERRYGQSQ
jgi:lipopolysaccharide export LptBFGC system permease protein LptF